MGASCLLHRSAAILGSTDKLVIYLRLYIFCNILINDVYVCSFNFILINHGNDISHDQTLGIAIY